MFRIDQVRERIAARVPDLAGNLDNAAAFARVVESRHLPIWRRGGFVLPGRLTGGQVSSLTGMFRQALETSVMVVLVARVAANPTADRALDEISPLITDVVSAVCGWGPDDAPGIYALVRGELAGSQADALIFELEFALTDQLRIIP